MNGKKIALNGKKTGLNGFERYLFPVKKRPVYTSLQIDYKAVFSAPSSEGAVTYR